MTALISQLINPRLWLSLALATALAWTHWQAYNLGGNSARAQLAQYQADHEQSASAAAQDRAAVQIAQSTTVIKAQNDQTNRMRQLALDAAVAGSERDLLRYAYQRAISSLPTPATPAADASADHCGPERELLSTMGAALERAARVGADMAAAADGHVSDKVTLQEAFPK